MTACIIVPMLGRAHRVQPVVESIAANTPEPHSVVFVCSDRDHEVLAEVCRLEQMFFTLPYTSIGDYARKIHAAMRRAPAEITSFFTGADDLQFHAGWLAAALAALTGPIGVVGTQDLCNPRVIAGEHATHFLVARWYVEQHGTIDGTGLLFHEGYWHECVDDELVGTAKHRGAYAFAADSIVEHLHPMAGKAPMDDMYAQQRVRLREGRRIFRQREHLWTSP